MPIEKVTKNILRCQVCNREFGSRRSVGLHVRSTHNLTSKEYYDRFYKTEKENICLCGRIKEYNSHLFSYLEHCSPRCAQKNPNTRNKQKQTVLEKYGVTNISKSEKIKKQKKETCFKNYGVQVPMQSKIIHDKYKSTCLEKYGVEEFGCTKQCIDKRKQTCMERYGKEQYLSTKVARDKINKTVLERYGVRIISQDPKIFQKIKTNSLKRKQYKLPSGKTIYLLGYEPNLLKHIFKNNIFKENEIDYSPRPIAYISVSKKKSFYFPDFYIKYINLFIEVKSTWTLKEDKNYKRKRNACIKQGYRHVLVLDNNFSEFDKHLKSITV